MYSCGKQKRILYYEVRAERGNLLNDIPGSPKVIRFCLVGVGWAGEQWRRKAAAVCKPRRNQIEPS